MKADGRSRHGTLRMMRLSVIIMMMMMLDVAVLSSCTHLIRADNEYHTSVAGR